MPKRAPRWRNFAAKGCSRPRNWRQLKSEFEEQWPAYLTLEATDSLCRVAGELAEKYGLRGFDSIHLASFAEVARRAGTDDTRFSSFDDQLNQAARKLRRTLERTGRK